MPPEKVISFYFAAAAAKRYEVFDTLMMYDFDFDRHTISEVILMAKQGMKRPERTHTKPRNEISPVPELQGKAKTSNEKAKPITER